MSIIEISRKEFDNLDFVKDQLMFVDGKKFCGGHSKPIAPLFNNKMNFLARKIYN